jgi:hypothetical protein
MINWVTNASVLSDFKMCFVSLSKTTFSNMAPFFLSL